MELIFRLLTLILVAFTIQKALCDDEHGNKTSEFLKKTFENYDRNIRPFFGVKPVIVTVSAYVLDVSNVDEVNQDFTVTLYLRQEWKDPRLEYTEAEAGTDKLGLSEDYFNKIWKADSFIVNERESQGHNLVTENRYVRISPDGTVLISNRFTVKVACSMDLGWFPFDRHTCPLIIESYGHNAAHFIYKWKVDDQGSIKTAVTVSRETTSIKFAVAAVNTREEAITVKSSSKSYSRIAVEFFFIRASTRFVHEIYFPAILLTFISFITLLHSTGTSKARLQLSILVEAVMIILMAISAKSIPPVSYQTALDFYLVICLVTITFVVLVNIGICLIVSNSNESNGVVRLRSVADENTNAEDDGKEVLFDTGPRFSSKTSRVLSLSVKLRFVIPLIFAVFNLLYWMVVLIGSSIFPDDFLILEDLGE